VIDALQVMERNRSRVQYQTCIIIIDDSPERRWQHALSRSSPRCDATWADDDDGGGDVFGRHSRPCTRRWPKVFSRFSPCTASRLVRDRHRTLDSRVRALWLRSAIPCAHRHFVIPLDMLC
jgi:hypothetical protein